MDIRIADGKAELYECEKLSKEELEFVLFLINLGGYWEFRTQGDIYSVHDEGNYKYKGTIQELRKEIGESKQ